MKKSILMFILCSGIIDTVYNDYIRQVTFSKPVAKSDDYRAVYIARGMVLVNSANGIDQIAGRCYLFDFYHAETGRTVNALSSTIDKHGFRHWVDDFSPGDGFLP